MYAELTGDVLVEEIFLFCSIVSHTIPYYLVFLLGEQLCLYAVQFSAVAYSKRKSVNVLFYIYYIYMLYYIYILRGSSF